MNGLIGELQSAAAIELADLAVDFRATGRGTERRDVGTVCPQKEPGLLVMTLNTRDLGFPPEMDFPIVFDGQVLADPAGRTLVRWLARPFGPRCFRAVPGGGDPVDLTIETVLGRILTSVSPQEPPEGDSDCAGRGVEWRLRLAPVDGDPPSILLINGRLGCDAIGWSLFFEATNFAFRGSGGPLTVPPPPPPGVSYIDVRTGCVLRQSRDQDVPVEAVLRGPIHPAHLAAGFRVHAEARENASGSPFPVQVEAPVAGSVRVRLAVTIPSGFGGDVRVDAWTSGPDRRSAVFPVHETAVLCGPIFRPEFYYYHRWVRLPDPCIYVFDCGFGTLTNFRDLAVHRDGLVFRIRRDGRTEYLSQPIQGRVALGGMNLRGDVVGGVTYPDGNFRGLLWLAGDTHKPELLEPVMVERAFFTAIGDSGVAVGYTADGSTLRPISYHSGQLRSLDLPEGNTGIARAVNASGQVTGTWLLGTGKGSAFLWADDDVQDLGDLGGGFSTGVAVNAAGTVAGYSRTPDGDEHPFRFDAESGLEDLGLPAGFSHGRATDLNDAGVVVGVSYGSRETRSTGGFLYMPEAGMRDLNDIIQPDLGLVIGGALAINDASEILAYGWRDNTPCYGVLVPAREPKPLS